ncbi:MAG: hypothetical protein A4E63_02781 [Syntrophorhabdus sp. PtaU1.Bin050]|nr:MAG: hypothetical protein A4E63_02781 [Syntrophorhabdus sp. PtaU1.Bin050]
MSIAIIGMLDEREEALGVIKNEIEQRGFKTCLIDISIGSGGTVPSLCADVSASEVAESGQGLDLGKEPAGTYTKDTITWYMGEGLRKKVCALYESGELEGVIAIAGLTGTLMALQAMKMLPFGFPKVLLSSATAIPAYAASFAEYFALKDITVMHTVVDTVGMNDLVKLLAINGANAISGMVKAAVPLNRTERPLVAITEFGLCDKGAHYIREILKKDYGIVSFHANGQGDKAAIDLVKQGYFKAFIDLVPSAFGEYLLGGNRSAGPHRLNVAMDNPIPYVFCPGGFDIISCGPLERRDTGDPLWVSRRLSERKYHMKDGFRCEARTSVEEMELLGTAVAEKLNLYKNKELVKVVIPRKGFSILSVEGGALFDPVADRAFIMALRQGLDPHIVITEVDTDINNPGFAKVVVAALLEVLQV